MKVSAMYMQHQHQHQHTEQELQALANARARLDAVCDDPESTTEDVMAACLCLAIDEALLCLVWH